jgi:hypothetical protein
MLIAGTIKRFRIDDFISVHAARYGYALARRDYLDANPRTMLYDLCGWGREFRVFYCESSPSSQPGARLIGAFKQHISRLTSEGFAASPPKISN